MLFSEDRHIQAQQDSKDIQSYETQIINWIASDDLRMDALRIAATLNLNDWCLAAGFVRALIWDKLHGFENLTKLDDFDLIYFDKGDIREETDRQKEQYLKEISDYPWSVKNQARMHIRNQDQPYLSTSDAMTYWVEVETAIGVRLNRDGKLELIKPFGIESLFEFTVTLNQKRPKPDAFQDRLAAKRWLQIWPKLRASR